MGSELAVQGWAGWLQLIVGTVVFLLPGVALADRIFPKIHHLLFAPVVSFSILATTAIALDFTLGLPITAASSFALALLIALWAGWPRIIQAWHLASRHHAT